MKQNYLKQAMVFNVRQRELQKNLNILTTTTKILSSVFVAVRRETE